MFPRNASHSEDTATRKPRCSASILVARFLSSIELAGYFTTVARHRTSCQDTRAAEGGCMRADLRRRLEMAERVRDFFRTHQTDGVTQAGEAKRLEQLVQRAEELASQQRAGVVATRGAAEQRADVRRAVQSKLLRYLSAVGAAAARANTELGAQFRLPKPRGSNQAFLTMARGMLEKATALKDALVARGMSAKLLDDFSTTLGEFGKR